MKDKTEVSYHFSEFMTLLNLKVITIEQTSGTVTNRLKIHPFTFGDGQKLAFQNTENNEN